MSLLKNSEVEANLTKMGKELDRIMSDVVTKVEEARYAYAKSIESLFDVIAVEPSEDIQDVVSSFQTTIIQQLIDYSEEELNPISVRIANLTDGEIIDEMIRQKLLIKSMASSDNYGFWDGYFHAMFVYLLKKLVNKGDI